LAIGDAIIAANAGNGLAQAILIDSYKNGKFGFEKNINLQKYWTKRRFCSAPYDITSKIIFFSYRHEFNETYLYLRILGEQTESDIVKKLKEHLTKAEIEKADAEAKWLKDNECGYTRDLKSLIKI
jgi:hypothetical protein